jgi:hypothetical protein
MTQTTMLQRQFCVRGVAETAARAHLVEGVSFEDAALHFVEDHHPVAGPDDEVSLYVEDVETGERQCFTIDLETGDAEPCA